MSSDSSAPELKEEESDPTVPTVPTVTRAHTKCRKCDKRFDAHKGGLCPDGSGRVFSKHRPRIAASQSFSEREVMLMSFIVDSLLRGRDVRVAMRHKEFPQVAKKIKDMKGRIAAVKIERAQEDQNGQDGQPGQ